MKKIYAICEECGLVAEAEKVNVGVGWVGRYDHCNWSHECSISDLHEKKDALLLASYRSEST